MQYIFPGQLDEVANTHLSQGIRSGDLIFISGQLAIDDNLKPSGQGRCSVADP